MSTYTEDHLVEQPAIQLMQHELGWDVVNCYDEWSGSVSVLGRDGKREVVLVSRLRSALQRLNPDLPVEAIEGAVEEISRDRTALSLVEANRETDKLLKQGVKVSFSPLRARRPAGGDPRVSPIRFVSPHGEKSWFGEIVDGCSRNYRCSRKS